jgi:hypothetical protein
LDDGKPTGATVARAGGRNRCYIGADRVRVRETAGVESDILCVLPCGTEVIRLEYGEEWSKVRYGDITGYVRNDLLSEEAPESPPTAQVTGYLQHARIVVRKSRRILELWDGNTLIGSYSVGLGWTPEGPKRAEGDGRTPEGEYYVCLRNPNSSYYLSLGLSYPNKDDARKRALTTDSSAKEPMTKSPRPSTIAKGRPGTPLWEARS